jgi:hypothetical protein
MIRAQVKAALEECRQRRLRGDLKTYVASSQCENSRIISAYENINYPYMDLVQLLAAARLAGSERIDNGHATEAAMQLQLAELQTRIASEEGPAISKSRLRKIGLLSPRAARMQAIGPSCRRSINRELTQSIPPEGSKAPLKNEEERRPT